MENMNKGQVQSVSNERAVAALVSILFTAGDEIKMSVLEDRFGADIFPLALAKARTKLRELGLVVLSDESSLQLAVAPEFSELAAEWQALEQVAPLSSAALETLATICYLNGASKAEIDFVRGVNSYFTLRKLSIRGMLQMSAAKVYQPTIEALANLGIQRVQELPDWELVNATLREQLHGQVVDMVE